MNYKNSFIVNYSRKIRDFFYYKKGPSILLVTLPKSGTAYILSYLSKGLRYRVGHKTFGLGFPHSHIVLDNLKDFMAGGFVGATHMSSEHECLTRLNNSKIIFHVRDPRQTTLSWTHFVTKHGAHNLAQGYMHVDPRTKAPEEYLTWRLEKRLDFMIDNYLPICVLWIEQWLDLIDNAEPNKYLLLTYEEFIEDENIYFDKILSFYNIPRASFSQPNKNKINNAHFRSGKKDEWLTVYSEEQKKRAREIISPGILERFEWEL